MFFKKLVDEKSLGRGWVRVVINADSAIAGFARCSIERVGLREPYLGRGGWQVASHFLDIEITVGEGENQFNFLLGPEVVRHMKANSNYQLTITDVRAVVLGVLQASWRGVPGYIPPVTTGSPTGIMIEKLVSTTPQPLDEGVKEDSLVWGLGSATAIEVELDSTSTSTPAFPDEVIDVAVPEALEPVEVKPLLVPKPIFKVNCPHGNHKIMSNMVFCPICSKSV
jgi:hypothetical protein